MFRVKTTPKFKTTFVVHEMLLYSIYVLLTNKNAKKEQGQYPAILTIQA